MKCREAALKLYELLKNELFFMTAFESELDMVIWAQKGKKASEISALSMKIFEAAAENDLHLAVAFFPRAIIESWWDIEWDTDSASCLR